MSGCVCVCAVSEWRSLWQLDMRYTDVSVDDVIREMADVHVDVKLRAIITCARAVEFAAPLSHGKSLTTQVLCQKLQYK